MHHFPCDTRTNETFVSPPSLYFSDHKDTHPWKQREEMFLLLRHHKTNSSSPHPCVHASNSQSPGIIKRCPRKRSRIFFFLVSWVLRGRTIGQDFFLGVSQSKTGNYLSATSFWENESFCCRLLHTTLHAAPKYRYRQNKHRNGGERRSIKQVGGGATPHQL